MKLCEGSLVEVGGTAVCGVWQSNVLRQVLADTTTGHHRSGNVDLGIVAAHAPWGPPLNSTPPPSLIGATRGKYSSLLQLEYQLCFILHLYTLFSHLPSAND